jgi:hypothetical protein
VILEWVAQGRPLTQSAKAELSIAELCLAYRRHAQSYYRIAGKLSREIPLRSGYFARPTANKQRAVSVPGSEGPASTDDRAGWSRKQLTGKLAGFTAIPLPVIAGRFMSGASQPRSRAGALISWDAAATEARQKFGLDAAQAVLRHARASTTEICAKLSQQKLRGIMIAVGKADCDCRAPH